MTSSAPLTQRQSELLAFMLAFEAANDSMPTARTIAEHFGWKSPNSAFEQVESLARKGCLERNAQGGWKFARGAPPKGRAGTETNPTARQE